MAPRPVEQLLPVDERDRIRAAALAEAPRYSPLGHLLISSLSGLIPLSIGLSLLHQVRLWQLGFAALVFLLSNAVEWRVHRDVLHKRVRPLELLYDRHTPLHHRVYVTDDMAMRDRREFRLVLIPAYGIFLVCLMTLPLFGLLLYLGQRNLAGLFLATSMGYVVSYEWLHLAYHCPANSFIGRLRIVRFLRRTHAIHHDPRLMQRWNFNVTLPLWDVLRRTYVRSVEAALARKAVQ